MGDLGWIPALGRSPGGGHGNLLQYSCLEKPKESGLAGYSPWHRKELDMSERLTQTDMLRESNEKVDNIKKKVGDGQASLVCCSPRGYKELDMTE